MKRRTFLGTALAALSVVLTTASVSLRAAAAQVASALKPRPRGVRLPPIPKWNPATDDIDNVDFMRRCGDFERSFLPSNIVFPRTGQIWEAVRDCEVHAIPPWPTARKGMTVPKPPAVWPTVRLQRGMKVRILELNDPRPLTIPFVPLANLQLSGNIEARPSEYRLSLSTAPTFASLVPTDKSLYFCDLFRLVQDAA